MATASWNLLLQHQRSVARVLDGKTSCYFLEIGATALLEVVELFLTNDAFAVVPQRRLDNQKWPRRWP